MSKPIFLFLKIAFCFSCIFSFGQQPTTVKNHYKRNAIIISTGKSYFYDRNIYSYQQSNLFSITTFTYERHITPKFISSISYGQRFLFFGQEGQGVISYHTPDVPTNLKPTGESQLWRRRKYSYADIKVGYDIFSKKGFELKADIGISSTWGANTYRDYVWINPEPPSDALFYSSTKKEFNMGFISSLNCSYLFWKDRLSAGVFGTGRHYPGLHSTQLDLGFQVGYNF